MTRKSSMVLIRNLEAARVTITLEDGLIWLDVRTDDSMLHGVELLVTKTDVVELIALFTDTLKLVTKP